MVSLEEGPQIKLGQRPEEGPQIKLGQRPEEGPQIKLGQRPEEGPQIKLGQRPEAPLEGNGDFSQEASTGMGLEGIQCGELESSLLLPSLAGTGDIPVSIAVS
ncbi:uncharacterized protein ACIB01_020001 [Guaruba guarouba]